MTSVSFAAELPPASIVNCGYSTRLFQAFDSSDDSSTTCGEWVTEVCYSLSPECPWSRACTRCSQMYRAALMLASCFNNPASMNDAASDGMYQTNPVVSGFRNGQALGETSLAGATQGLTDRSRNDRAHRCSIPLNGRRIS